MFRLAGLSAILMVQLALGQTATATLGGTVVDATGSAVPGATVTIKSAALGQERSDTTTDEGPFRVPFLPPGQQQCEQEHQQKLPLISHTSA